MQKFVQDRWKHVGAVEVFGLENGMFVFDFEGCDLSRKILDEGPWTLGSRPLILRPWSPDVSLSRKVETELPLWVRFYGLNLHYWGDRTLGRIASVLGRPICADKRTVRRERLSFARVCVSIQASDGLPTTIYIAQDDGTLVEQAVQYDWIPPLCSTCKVYGHVDASCPISAVAKEQAGGVEVHDSSIVDDGWVRQNSHRRRGKRQVQIPPSAVVGSASPVTGAGVGDLTVRKPMEVITPRGVAGDSTRKVGSVVGSAHASSAAAAAAAAAKGSSASSSSSCAAASLYADRGMKGEGSMQVSPTVGTASRANTSRVTEGKVSGVSTGAGGRSVADAKLGSGSSSYSVIPGAPPSLKKDILTGDNRFAALNSLDSHVQNDGVIAYEEPISELERSPGRSGPLRCSSSPVSK
ncbi:uncharacterized protein LOC122643359 [Telopea speciosissima]|uniref:uncharacterized protein LOC122643359 n=1 Tax=Telopea speciosissima TaxID=54955 RepID=UPI001CC4DE00|nr:uncharacterized protein LOC122643359 [Telopea speciosissima]